MQGNLPHPEDASQYLEGTGRTRKTLKTPMRGKLPMKKPTEILPGLSRMSQDSCYAHMSFCTAGLLGQAADGVKATLVASRVPRRPGASGLAVREYEEQLINFDVERLLRIPEEHGCACRLQLLLIVQIRTWTCHFTTFHLDWS